MPVVAFVDLERTEQIKLFMDINENQKAVPKSLRVTLNADMLWESNDLNERRQALRSKIAQMLGEEPTSPLRSRVIVGEAEAAPGRCITIEAIQASVEKSVISSTSTTRKMNCNPKEPLILMIIKSPAIYSIRLSSIVSNILERIV